MHHSLPGRKLFLLVLFSYGFIQSFACTCSSQSSVQASFDGATVVVTGKVVKTEYVGLIETLNPDSVLAARAMKHENSKNYLDSPMVLKATILVTNAFKGVAPNDTIVVYTGIRGATCGYKFETNKEYTIYGTTENYMHMFLRLDRKRFKNLGKKGVYWTSICSRTTIAVGQEQGLLNEYLKKK